MRLFADFKEKHALYAKKSYTTVILCLKPDVFLEIKEFRAQLAQATYDAFETLLCLFSLNPFIRLLAQATGAN